MKIKYSRLAGTYEAEYNHGYGNLKYNQAVILSKILLESRALRVEEVREIIDTFVERAVDDRERQRIRNFTERELEEYKELSIYRDNKSKSILPHLSAIFDAIENQKPLFLSIRNTKVRMPIMMCYRSRLCLMIIIFIVWHIKLKKKMED